MADGGQLTEHISTEMGRYSVVTDLEIDESGETIVYRIDDGGRHEVVRKQQFPTHDEARAAHAQIVEALKAGGSP